MRVVVDRHVGVSSSGGVLEHKFFLCVAWQFGLFCSPASYGVAALRLTRVRSVGQRRFCQEIAILSSLSSPKQVNISFGRVTNTTSLHHPCSLHSFVATSLYAREVRLLNMPTLTTTKTTTANKNRKEIDREKRLHNNITTKARCIPALSTHTQVAYNADRRRQLWEQTARDDLKELNKLRAIVRAEQEKAEAKKKEAHARGAEVRSSEVFMFLRWRLSRDAQAALVHWFRCPACCVWPKSACDVPCW